MSKELDELRREYAENEAKLQQYQHRVKRLEQRRQYYDIIWQIDKPSPVPCLKLSSFTKR